VGPANIDKLWHTISIEVPSGTDATALIPTIELSAGAQILPGSGTAGNFTAPLIYTVVAEDGTTRQIWTVTVHVLINDQTDIESFSLGKSEGLARIDKLSFSVELDVPYGTDVSALVPAITISVGATILPGSGVQVDFTNPVTYLVTAEDGATEQKWIITVRAVPNDQTDIESFSFAEEAGPATINKLLHSVSIEVEQETDLSTLIPSIDLSEGASIDPGSDQITDFNTPVVYTVTAEDGVSVQNWTVTVTSREEAVNVNNADVPGGVSIYPNPAREFVQIEFSGKADISLFDITGRIAITLKDVSEKVSIPVAGLERGTYLVHVKRIDSHQVFRLLLE